MVSNGFLLTVLVLLLSEKYNFSVQGVMLKPRDNPGNSSIITFSDLSSNAHERVKEPSIETRLKSASAHCGAEKTCRTKGKSGRRKIGTSKKQDKLLEVKPSFQDDSDFFHEDADGSQFTQYTPVTTTGNNLLPDEDFDLTEDHPEEVSSKSNGGAVEDEQENWKVRPRLIAVKVPASPPRTELRNDSNPLTSLYAKYPTVRLADFARKIIFPEWIWRGFQQPPPVKKSEIGEDGGPDEPISARPAHLLNYNETFVPTTTTRRPKGVLERPTITFDNNMSRCIPTKDKRKVNN